MAIQVTAVTVLQPAMLIIRGTRCTVSQLLEVTPYGNYSRP